MSEQPDRVARSAMSAAASAGGWSRRRLLLAAGLGAGALLAGCAVRVGPRPDEAGFVDDGRRAVNGGAPVERDGFAFAEADWFDAGRDRPVPVRLYLPRGPQHAGARPLVVFSHGLGGSRRGYSYLGSHFAKNGIAALHVQHVGSDRAVWIGSPLDIVARLQAAAAQSEAVARAADLRHALDRLLALPAGDPLHLPVDRTRLVVAGHSYGANSALLASGARVQRSGADVDLRDARYGAAIVMSAPPFYGEAALDPILRPVTLPTLHVTTTDDEIRVPGYFSAPSDRIAVFEATGGTRKALAVFAGGAHSIFTDRTAPGGAELNAQVKSATQELALAFLPSAFERRDAALTRWIERHRALVARFVAPATA